MNTWEKSRSEDQGISQPTGHTVGTEGKKPALPATVGIGASAGGHEALEQIFCSLPADTGFSFVVVMHLPQEGPSLLAGILRQYTAMQVHTIENGMALDPNTVYVPPPGMHLTMHGGQFLLHPHGEAGYSRNPIDRFFSSLAAELKQQAVAVILSGYGDDGSEGVKRVKEGGGLILAQDPQTAASPFMPQSAIKTGAVDWILSAQEIAERLVQFAREGAYFSSPTDDELQALFAVLQNKTNHDFSSYKKNTIHRRIKRRIDLNCIEKFSDYLELLKNNIGEAHACCQELLIGVTNFFRDREAFESLTSKVIPSLIASHKSEEPLRIWHACCATGEEVYSVAMLILEYLERENVQTKVQIFASDLDYVAIAHARAGVYTGEIAADVGEERLQRFFVRNQENWQVTKQLREMIVFAHHNIIKDPPFSRLDLLVCRNFLIYLNPDIQKLLIPLFHQVLNPGGILFLGSAETIGQHGDLFAPVDQKWKIFVRQGVNRQVEALLPFTGPVRKFNEIAGHSARSSDADKTAAIALVDKLLMDRYVPARIIINEKNEVVHFSSRAGAYLITPEGEPTRDLLRLVREELRPGLRAAIYKAFNTQNEVAYRGIRVKTEHDEITINLVVIPPKELQMLSRQALVIIEPAVPAAVSPSAVEESFSDDASNRNALICQLEEQLHDTSEQLQSTTEQLESTNERFMLTSEELMTVNEELQSSNEELQSTNEELITVNAELQQKMEELNKSNSDLENLLTSSGIATFFLCPKFSIKHYSPAMADIFNLTPADIGRSIRHLDTTIDWSNLPLDAASVLKHLEPIEREVQSHKDGRSYIMRILPYKTTEGIIDGIVITLVDISERKRSEAALYASQKALREGDERLRFALETCHIGAWDLNLEDQRAYRSSEHSRIFGYAEMLPQWSLQMFIDHVLPEDRANVQAIIQQGMESQNGWSFECRIRRADGQMRWIWAAGRPNVDAFGNRRMTGLVQDITTRKEMERENLSLLAAVQQERDKLSSLVDSMVDEVWFADTRKQFTLANPSALKTFGIDITEELDIEKFAASLQVFRPDGSPRPIEEAPSLRALQGEIVKNLEETIRIPTSGELRHREVSANPVRDTDGNIIGSVAVVRDVTERKAAEETLLLYHLLSNNSRDIILFVRREDGCILEFNAAALAAYGYAREELLGLNILDLCDSIAIQLTEAQMTEADLNGVLFETVHRRKDGTTFPVEVSSQGTDYGGERIMLSVIRDISERKRAACILQESRARLAASLSSMADAVLISDNAGEFIEFNEAFATFHKFDSKEACPRKLEEYHDIVEVFMEDGGLLPLDMWAISRGLRGETVSNAVYSLRRKDTGASWVGSFSFAPIRDNDGLIVGSVVVGRDITEFKRQEEALRLSEQRRALALEAAQAGTWEWNLLTNENIWSNELWGLYGLEPDSCEPSYEQWRKTIHPDDLLKAEKNIQEAVNQGVPFTTEWRAQLGDDAERWLMSRGKPVKDSTGQVVRYLGIVIDNTKQKKADEEKRILQAQLIQAQKMEAIGTLAGGIAHDLNNILFPISGLTEMLLDEMSPDNPAFASLEQIHKSAMRGGDLVKQILAFSRQSNPQKLPIQIQPILKEVLHLTRATIPKNIEISSRISSDCGMVSADPTQIHQILMNLITNAYHAVETTGGRIDISLEETMASNESLPGNISVSNDSSLLRTGRYAYIRVSDTGPGIDPVLIHRIFEPYFTTKEMGKGTGLGLSVVHGIIKEHCGDIRVSSQQGQGAVFHVYIPLIETEGSHKSAVLSRNYPTGTEHILLVDDEDPILKMEQIIMEKLGYQVTARASSQDALGAFRANPAGFDLVLSDMGMPNMTGEQLARELISIKPDIPIIICTGFSDEDDENRARDIGVKAFLKKPVARGDLAEMVRKVLDEASLCNLEHMKTPSDKYND